MRATSTYSSLIPTLWPALPRPYYQPKRPCSEAATFDGSTFPSLWTVPFITSACHCSRVATGNKRAVDQSTAILLVYCNVHRVWIDNVYYTYSCLTATLSRPSSRHSSALLDHTPSYAAIVLLSYSIKQIVITTISTHFYFTPFNHLIRIFWWQPTTCPTGWQYGNISIPITLQ